MGSILFEARRRTHASPMTPPDDTTLDDAPDDTALDHAWDRAATNALRPITLVYYRHPLLL